MTIRLRLLVPVFLLSAGLAGAQEPSGPALKTVFEGEFLVGGALNGGHVSGRNAAGQAVALRHFNSITPENVLKWESVHPRPDSFNFAPVDALVDLATRNGMFIVGHTLVWHSQTPAWVFQDAAGRPASRELLLERMRDHITRVVGRYKGRIHGWDVVNEAVAEDGSLRRSPWLEIIGEDYIETAFRLVREVDPQAELYYNEFNAWKPAKRDGVVRLVRSLQAKGIPVTAVGMQGHYGIDYPIAEMIDAAFAAYAALGVKVNVSELDVDMLPNPTGRQGSDIIDPLGRVPGYDPFAAGLPIVEDQRLAKRYGEIFQVFRANHEVIDRITFWGVGDRDSWLNGWPIPGRTNYPLIFDREYRPKAAFEVIVNTKLRAAR